jgi:hypothetical protein
MPFELLLNQLLPLPRSIEEVSYALDRISKALLNVNVQAIYAIFPWLAPRFLNGHLSIEEVSYAPDRIPKALFQAIYAIFAWLELGSFF